MTDELSHHDEFRLYHSNRYAWAEYVAPRWAQMLANADKDERRRLWLLACPELQDALHRLKESR